MSPSSKARTCPRTPKPLADIAIAERGWTLDVLNIVRRLTDAKRARFLDCGDTSPLSPTATCRGVPKRGHVHALQCGAYEAMMNAIRRDETPNFYFRVAQPRRLLVSAISA